MQCDPASRLQHEPEAVKIGGDVRKTGDSDFEKKLVHLILVWKK